MHAQARRLTGLCALPNNGMCDTDHRHGTHVRRRRRVREFLERGRGAWVRCIDPSCDIARGVIKFPAGLAGTKFANLPD